MQLIRMENSIQRKRFNQYKPNGNPYSYKLDESISILRVVGGMFLFYLKFKTIFCKGNSGNSDQMPRSAASDLGLDCLSMSLKKDARFTWVNIYIFEAILQ